MAYGGRDHHKDGLGPIKHRRHDPNRRFAAISTGHRLPAGREGRRDMMIADRAGFSCAARTEGADMPKAYVIFTERVTDPEGMAAYARAAAATLQGVRVLAVDAAPQTLEGEWHGDQTVMLEFESVEAARAWYDGEAYSAVRPLRQAAGETNAVILTGIEVPAGG